MYNKIDVSIIVPVYNTENFLIQCLDSLVKQTLDNIEIIIIDDGSTDKSLSICRDFTKISSKVRLIKKCNEGLGKTYNLGISLAKGKYIGFVESDDFVDINMFKILYDTAKQNSNPDMVKATYFSFSLLNITKKNKFKMYKNIFNKLLSEPLQVPEIYLGHPSHWSAIYRSSFLKDNNIVFNDTKGASCQDAGFSFLVYCNLHKFVIIEDSLYYYRTDNINSSQNEFFDFAYNINMKERLYIQSLFDKRKIPSKFKEIEALKILHSFKYYLKKGEKSNISYQDLFKFLKKNSYLFNLYSNINYKFFSRKEIFHFILIKKAPLFYLLSHCILKKLQKISLNYKN